MKQKPVKLSKPPTTKNRHDSKNTPARLRIRCTRSKKPKIPGKQAKLGAAVGFSWPFLVFFSTFLSCVCSILLASHEKPKGDDKHVFKETNTMNPLLPTFNLVHRNFMGSFLGIKDQKGGIQPQRIDSKMSTGPPFPFFFFCALCSFSARSFRKTRHSDSGHTPLSRCGPCVSSLSLSLNAPSKSVLVLTAADPFHVVVPFRSSLPSVCLSTITTAFGECMHESKRS